MKYAFVFLLATALPAQISNLTTTANGSELQFISVFGTPSNPTSIARHYAYAPGAPVELFRADNPYIAEQPLFPVLSDDGQTRGLITYRSCFGPCMFYVPSVSVDLVRNGKSIQYQSSGYNIRISRNGRWIFSANNIYDVDNGTTVSIPSVSTMHSTHAIADDGTTLTTSFFPGFHGVPLIPDPFAFRVIENGRPEPVEEVRFTDSLLSAGISQNGQNLFALTKTTLYQLDRQTRTPREIYTSTTPLVAFCPSASGNEVLVHDGNQAVLIRSGIAGPVYESPEPIQDILLAADGQTYFILTRYNRLTRFTAGEPTELYPPFPASARQTSSGAVPGSLIRLSGGPFPEGLSFSVQGRAFPAIATAIDTYEVQIPWDYPVDATNQFVLTRAGSPFALTDKLTMQTQPVAAIYTRGASQMPNPDAKAVQSDFRSLISEDNPAPAGSTIHFWLTGLGALDRPLANAEPGPIDPPARPLAPFACYIFQGDAVRGLEIPFAAYAPGLVGVYQIDAIVPADWPPGPSSLTCAVGQNPPVSSATIYVRAN